MPGSQRMALGIDCELGYLARAAHIARNGIEDHASYMALVNERFQLRAEVFAREEDGEQLSYLLFQRHGLKSIGNGIHGYGS
ncbi:hypothetical protein DFE_0507 [Desulfovibrio ferrophilus]|uniref:Uncharacterized protein n=1 Tax=Desulfovibrio ferrophilus TaxID=241368 RepID=A0A2Z6AVI8_9BACT|nr:hypothetical protein DFE_0507 [Desulfovibrio ferrophilus]